MFYDSDLFSFSLLECQFYDNATVYQSYNPLGDAISSCPATDWRYPPVIDGYNSIIKSLCEKHELTYLDTNDIIGPMWDSGNDFCHLSEKVGMAEAFYMLSTIIMS
jgi:hypothetical protein